MNPNKCKLDWEKINNEPNAQQVELLATYHEPEYLGVPYSELEDNRYPQVDWESVSK